MASISALIVTLVGLAGYFDRDPVHLYPAVGKASKVAVINFAGDMGLRFLLGSSTSRGLTQNGVTVVGITSPVLFRRHRTRAEVDAIVANGVRVALQRTGAAKLVVMGQSFGADIVQTGVANLPAALRSRVAGVVLILPGDEVFFRADPTGIEYLGHPDSIAARTANTITWTPVTCIYGVEEDDSLCPQLHIPGAYVVGLPGGHNLKHDSGAVLAQVFAAVQRAARNVDGPLAPGARPLPGVAGARGDREQAGGADGVQDQHH